VRLGVGERRPGRAAAPPLLRGHSVRSGTLRFPVVPAPGGNAGDGRPVPGADQSVSLIAHDLRSPLSVIAGFADLLLEREGEITVEARREALAAIHRSAGRMGHLIDNVVELARIDAGELGLQPAAVDLVRLARDAVAEVVGPTRRGDVVVSQNGDVPPAWVDAARTWQVVTNLVTNAVSHTQPGQPVLVEVEAVDGEVCLAVRDHGPGIAAADQDRVFERFARLATPSAGERRGSGLGLYICRQLCEDQGGRIAVSSAPGPGATFIATLPAAVGRSAGG